MKFFTDVKDIDLSTDLWETLGKSGKKLVMYGTGNGADKIIEVLESKNLTVDDFVVSDEFYRGQSFHNKKVVSFSQAFTHPVEKHEDSNVVVAFGTRDKELISRIGSLSDLYIPDVPVVADDLLSEIFTLGYFEEHRERLQRVCDKLSDSGSKELLCDLICYRLTGDFHYLFHKTVERCEYYSLLGAGKFRTALDLGAYNGDTIRELSEYAKSLESVTAFEPDERNFRKLRDYPWNGSFTVRAINAAAWDEETTIEFTSGGNRNSSASSKVGVTTGAKVKEVRALRPDSAVEKCDFIKYDVEGAEEKALKGSEKLIEASRPVLSVAVYHRTEDLFRIPELVSELGYKELYLRRFACIPGWEVNLIAK